MGSDNKAIASLEETLVVFAECALAVASVQGSTYGNRSINNAQKRLSQLRERLCMDPIIIGHVAPDDGLLWFKGKREIDRVFPERYQFVYVRAKDLNEAEEIWGRERFYRPYLRSHCAFMRDPINDPFQDMQA